MQRVVHLLTRLGRMLSLVLLAALGSTLLLRYAPGYFTESRELDAAHAAGARMQLDTFERTQTSLPSLLRRELTDWAHGNLGYSRHYSIPVIDLVRQRAGVTAGLLLRGIGTGWCAAVLLALLLSARQTSRGEIALSGTTAILLAFPVGVLATLCLLLNKGGPVLVLGMLIATRDFKLLYRLLRASWRSPHILHARASGQDLFRIARVHLLPELSRELLAVAMMSVVVALSALVPVEVVFDIPGLGQLAWAAAINRDMPVLVAVTALLSGAIGFASLGAVPNWSTESV